MATSNAENRVAKTTFPRLSVHLETRFPEINSGLIGVPPSVLLTGVRRSYCLRSAWKIGFFGNLIADKFIRF